MDLPAPEGEDGVLRTYCKVSSKKVGEPAGPGSEAFLPFDFSSGVIFYSVYFRKCREREVGKEGTHDSVVFRVCRGCCDG